MLKVARMGGLYIAVEVLGFCGLHLSVCRPLLRSLVKLHFMHVLCQYGLRGCRELSSSVVHSEAQSVARAAAGTGPTYPRANA